MRANSYRVKRNFSPVLTIFSLLILSFCVLNSDNVYVSGSTQPKGVETKIDLASSSEPRFFDCGVSPVNGTSFLPELSVSESAQVALTDLDLNTIIMGKAIFDVSPNINSSIVNVPGPDLVVVEMENPEQINALIPNSKTEWKSLFPTPGNDTYTNDCQYDSNTVFVDLSDLGVPEGSAVTSVRFDNLGFPNTLVGSDIAEVHILTPQTNGNLSSESNLGRVPLFRQN